MDFTPSDEQEELRASVRSVLARACPATLVRQVFDSKHAGSAARPGAELWSTMVGLDWPGLSIAPDHGGLGLGFVELAMVAEELGRVVAPGPFLATVTQFAAAVRACPATDTGDRLLRAVAAGELTGALALAEEGGRWEPEAVTATARRSGPGWVLDGTKSFVLDGAWADEIAVVARTEGSHGAAGLGLFAVPGPEIQAVPLPVIDPTLPLARLTLGGVAVPAERVLLEPGDPSAGARLGRAVEEATACTAASTNGTSRAIFEATLAYAKVREQYGRPIGSFQAIKHRLVDMYLALERATALSAFAAMTIDEDDPRRSLAVAMAKAAAGDAQRLLVEDGLQLHGGIGFTWENDLHFLLKRAKSGDFLLGTAAVQRSVTARLLGVAG